MAYEGELVKMENGRWARFQRCVIANSGQQDSGEMALLVAVELDDHYQDLLSAAEESLDEYRRRGIPVHLRLDPEGQGKLSVSFESAQSATVQ